jgi:hypothetical protein
LRLNRLLLEAAFPEDITKSAPYALKAVPAPRYWQPKEPVILIVDEVDQTVRPSLRHGRDAGLRKEDGLLKMPGCRTTGCGNRRTFWVFSAAEFALEMIEGAQKVRFACRVPDR